MFTENLNKTFRYAKVKYTDVANGPGVRVSLYTQGCPHHCNECFNPETWDFNGGFAITTGIIYSIIETGKKPHIKGLSILGGEPFAQDLEMLDVIITTFKQETGKSVWVWTGYLLEDLQTNENAKKVLSHIDVLVDGPFVLSKKNLLLEYRGSSNQRVIDMKTGEVMFH